MSASSWWLVGEAASLPLLYLGGCILVTFLMDRWDSAFRPCADGEEMSNRGMAFGFCMIVLAYAWIIALLWVGGTVLCGVIHLL